MSDPRSPTENSDASSSNTANISEEQGGGVAFTAAIHVSPELAIGANNATVVPSPAPETPLVLPQNNNSNSSVENGLEKSGLDVDVDDKMGLGGGPGVDRVDSVPGNVQATPTPSPSFDPKTAFSKGRKAGILVVLTAWAFAGSAPNVVISPALPLIQQDLNTSAQAVNSSVSVATFFSGLAPLWWAAVSDLKGRRIVYLVSGPILILSSLAGFWTPNIGVFYLIRIVQQIAGSAVVSTGSGTLADIYPRNELASVLGTFYLGLTLGPTIGPAIGGVITQYGGWRWTFIFSAGLASVIFVFVVLFLPETMAPKVQVPGVKKENMFLKPFKSLAYNRYPFVFSIVSVIAMIFAVLFVMTVTVPRDFPHVYGFTTSQAGFVQLASGIGMLGGTYVSGRYSDYVFRRWKTKRLNVVVFEDRLRATWPGIVLLVIGCLMMGWGLQTAVHWAVPALGAVIAGWGVMSFATSTNAYLIDLFAANASSIIAAANFLRFTLAAVGPLTVAPMQSAMGIGWLWTFWAGMNLLAYACLCWVIFRGTVYRLKLEPWKSAKTAKDQLRAVGVRVDEEVGGTVELDQGAAAGNIGTAKV